MENWEGNYVLKKNFDEKQTLNNIFIGGDGNGHKILILKMNNKELKEYIRFCKLNSHDINFINKSNNVVACYEEIYLTFINIKPSLLVKLRKYKKLFKKD